MNQATYCARCFQWRSVDPVLDGVFVCSGCKREIQGVLNFLSKEGHDMPVRLTSIEAKNGTTVPGEVPEAVLKD